MLRLISIVGAIVVAATLACPVPDASATVLTFESLNVDPGDPVPSAYGDRVDPACTESGCCDTTGCYGQGVGFTPNVSVDYRTVDTGTGGTLQPFLDFWDTAYGDLNGVALAAVNAQIAEIALMPDPGYEVTLYAFDLGGWPTTDQAGQLVRILDREGAVLLSYPGTTIAGDAGHSAFVLPEPLVSGTGLRIQFSPSWRVAIDNIAFAQAIANDYLQCEADLAAANSDIDADGRRDLDDLCPETLAGDAVDRSGCSLAQFCAAVDATTLDGKRRCKRCDWQNDEPTMSTTARDCALERGARGAADDRCAPAAP